jgi:hypothetical protein
MLFGARNICFTQVHSAAEISVLSHAKMGPPVAVAVTSQYVKDETTGASGTSVVAT